MIKDYYFTSLVGDCICIVVKRDETTKTTKCYISEVKNLSREEALKRTLEWGSPVPESLLKAILKDFEW